MEPSGASDKRVSVLECEQSSAAFASWRVPSLRKLPFAISLNAGMDLAQRPQSTQRQRLTTLLWITVRVSHLGYLKLFQPFFFACLAPLREIFIAVFRIRAFLNSPTEDVALGVDARRSQSGRGLPALQDADATAEPLPTFRALPSSSDPN